ncbi:MAG: hypothetical protein PHX13_06515 [Thiovulaceae bacterium]|nr:hypothetical protein [Sulfurimonadaceae bacterium]
MDKKLVNKLIDGKIIYTIVYDQSDYYTALNIATTINKEYKGHLDKYDYTINLVEFSKFSYNTKATATYILNIDRGVEKIADISKQKGVISFSYDINNLEKGLMFSLMIEKSTVLYLNKENLSTKKIDFVDELFQIVRFIN